MQQNIWEQIANIPWPFYAFFILIILNVYKTTQDSIKPVHILYLLPVLLTLMSLLSIQITDNNNNIVSIVIWLISLGFGAFTGWSLYRSLGVQAIQGKKQIFIPGNYRLLCIMIAALSLQLLNAILLTIMPSLNHATLYTITWLLIGGYFSGIFFGRLSYSLKCLKKGPYFIQPSH